MPDLDTIGIEPHPVGTIIMWSGLLSNIPSGWFLCDGNNGTPDLIALFTRGSPPATEPLTELGEDQHTITSAEMPGHTHDTTGLGHKHDQEVSNTLTGGVGNTGVPGNANAGTFLYETENALGSFNNKGGNAPHENRPPFFELAYIQRMN